MNERADLQINQKLRMRRGATYPAIFVSALPEKDGDDARVRITAGDFSIQDWEILADYMGEDDRGPRS